MKRSGIFLGLLMPLAAHQNLSNCHYGAKMYLRFSISISRFVTVATNLKKFFFAANYQATNPAPIFM